MNYGMYHIPYGDMMIVEEEDAITEIRICKDGFDKKKQRESELTRRCYLQILEYLEGKRHTFDLPLNPKGTFFQKKVWKALLEIPYGEVRSYRQIAEAIGNEKACRAVGMANNRNPIPLVIPCHRVIGTNGSLVGYAFGLAMKKDLLELEEKGMKV